MSATCAVVHIGLPKTGTTSIQRFLAANIEELEAAGLRYPSFLRRENHLELAAYAVGEEHVDLARIARIHGIDHWRRWRPEFRQRFLAATASGGRWLFTSEHMASRIRDHAGVEDLATLLRQRFDEVEIIVYVRRQDDMAASSYSTWIKDGITKPLAAADVIDDADRYDLRRIVQRWQRVFGEDRVQIRLYPGSGAGPDLLEDFCDALRIGDRPGWIRPQRLNVALSSHEVDFLRRFNELVPRVDERRTPIASAGDPVPYVAGSIGGPPLRLGVEDATRIMEHYQDSNRWIMEHLTGPVFDEEYFSPENVGNADAEFSNEVTADEAIQIAARMWSGLHGERRAES